MSCYRQKQEIAWRDIQGEAVLLSPAEGIVFVLNDVGSRIWSLLEEPQPPAELTRRIAQTYRMAEDKVAGDVTRFLEELQERGLIEVS